MLYHVFTINQKVGDCMSIGSRIRDLRESKNISRNDFASMIGVTIGAVSNYENDVSSPKEPILFKIIEILDCDANYLFQDVVKIKTQKNDVTIAEYEIIKKYRDLDPHGKEMVDFTLEKEWERSTAVRDNVVTYSASPKAARNNYINEPGEVEKTYEDVSSLKRPE